MPRKIDEIGFIDENEYKSNAVPYSLTVPTKLNVITEYGASVEVRSNGTLISLTSANGPHPVLGNSNWVTYSIPNITGNVSVVSSKAVTAGISAGNDAMGYGGYFAGFSSVPLIVKVEGDCLPGVKLETTEGFDNYQWLEKIGNNYIPLTGEKKNYFKPTQAGIYAVKIKQASCLEVQTEDFKFFNCTTFTDYSYTTCSVQHIIPKFILSTQTINPNSLTIITPPKNGTVFIDATGALTYTANKNFSGIDHFFYSFCGTDSLPDCETVQATIKVPILIKENVRIDLQGSTVTVNVWGGNPPYRYALDNGTDQPSPVFLNVTSGKHTIHISSADPCVPLSIDIDVIQLYNVITPNSDGFNDVLNYSGLLKKDEPSLLIYNRNGKQVFKGDMNNQFSWNGKTDERSVSTESYWYVISWKEPGYNTFTQYKGWVLVKNRD